MMITLSLTGTFCCAGESPHGKYHVMHGDWRLWQPLLIKMALVVNNKFIKKDPIVSEFNEHEHFLRIVVEAFAEYVVEIAQTGQDYHNCANFLRRAERNLSFAYTCYFLFLSSLLSPLSPLSLLSPVRRQLGSCGLWCCA